MSIPPADEALRQIAALLGQAVSGRPVRRALLKSGAGVDARIRAGGHTFFVEWKSSGDTAAVGSAIRQLQSSRKIHGRAAVAVVAVPYMGEAGERLCDDGEVSWMDLAGNAHLEAPGLRILVRGNANPFKRRGRPSSAFAPKSSRISRQLLMNPGVFVAQRELAIAADVGEGYTSRIVHRLEGQELIERNDAGELRARDADLLLDAWAEDYDFDGNHFLKGHVAVRSGEELLARIAETAPKERRQYAATGLAGAWLLTHFAAFRTATVYVSALPGVRALNRIGFREGERGANLWWVIPKDDGVFQGVTPVEGFPCAHPVQVWLDLQGQPERAREAADVLRKKHLRWESKRG